MKLLGSTDAQLEKYFNSNFVRFSFHEIKKAETQAFYFAFFLVPHTRLRFKYFLNQPEYIFVGNDKRIKRRTIKYIVSSKKKKKKKKEQDRCP